MAQQAGNSQESITSESDLQASQILTFRIDGEQYGVDILCVQEIKGWGPISCLPNAPDYVRGVLNLRGVIVPIIDLRIRFGMKPAETTSTTVVIVLLFDSGSERKTYGIVVDSVSTVVDVDKESIKPVPEFGHTIDKDYLSDIATVDDKMVMLVKTDRIVSAKELNDLQD